MYDKSQPFEFIIPSGQNGSFVEAVDFGFNVEGLIITCEDVEGASFKEFRLEVSEEVNSALNIVHRTDMNSAEWTHRIPASGSFRVYCPDAYGAREVKVVLDDNSTSEISFVLYGV
jgi:hypothetical protein